MTFVRLLPQHVPQLRTTTEPRASIVDIVQAVEGLSRHIYSLDDIASKNTSAVNRIIESREFGIGFIVECVDKFLVGNISCFDE
jgi:hypothetical protein